MVRAGNVSARLVDAKTTTALKPVPSRAERTCGVCHGGIRPGAGRYRICESEYHPDCFKFWLTPLFDDAAR